VPALTDVVVPEPSQVPAKSTKAATAPTPTYYCLESSHDPRLLTDSRFFYWDLSSTDCPVCPVCNRMVSAQLVPLNAKGQPQIPPGLLELASRIGERI
jgi:hypothetical protein